LVKPSGLELKKDRWWCKIDVTKVPQRVVSFGFFTIVVVGDKTVLLVMV
jgi:hypothetical protein